MKRGRKAQNRSIEVERPAPPVGEIRCPVCKGTDFVALAAGDTQQRLQCALATCGEHFSVPKASAAALVTQLQEEAAKAPPPGDSRACPKCTKPFQRIGHWRDTHIANCKGKPWKGPRPSAPPPAATEPEVDEIAVPSAHDRAPGLKARVLDFIRRERDFHESEAELGRKLIEAIGQVNG